MMKLMFCRLSSLAIITLLCLTVTMGQSGQDLSLMIALKPVYQQNTRPVMQVSYTIKPGTIDDSTVFVFEKMDQGLERTIDTVTSLEILDESGIVPVTATTGKFKGPSVYQWRPTRKINGTLKLSYYVPVADSFPKKRGPHMDLQAAGDGLSGTFGSFLLVPYTDGKYDLKLNWDLPANQKAVTTFGEGNASAKFGYEQMMSSQFLAGSLVVYPEKNNGTGFLFYSLGKSLEESKHCIDWSLKTYALLRDSIHGDSTKAFRFLLRSYNGGPIMSGNATDGSFLLYVPKDRKLDSLDAFNLIAHEMVHVFVPGINDSTGMHNWYSEGIADYFSVILPYKARLYSSSEYLELINTEAALYYSNALRETPQSKIPDLMWQGTSNWSIPYSRGMLYFAILEARLKQTGNGITMLELIRQMNNKIKSGCSLDIDDWKKLLLANGGNQLIADLDQMLDGKLLFPPSSAFGNQFRSTKITTGYFDLGFKQPTKIRAGSIIEGLTANSNAEKAGLKNGDRILKDEDLIPIYSNFQKQLRLKLSRNGQEIQIEYNPRSGKVDALKWVRKN